MPSYAEITLRTPKWWKSGIWSADWTNPVGGNHRREIEKG
jgi:hypothetical protein